MKPYNFSRAIDSGKKTFKVTKGKNVRYVLASSAEQCQAKFTAWNVEEIPEKDFVFDKIEE